MTELLGALDRTGAILRQGGWNFCLVGGLAVSARTEPRFTRDVDLAVVVESDDAAQALVCSLLALGFTINAVVENDATDRMATVRMTADDGWHIDLLFASSGIEAEIVAGATDLEVVAGLVVPVASVGHLIALKLLSKNDATRPNDTADLRALSLIADPDDLLVAHQSVSLIVERGYHRGRDLIADLDLALRFVAGS
ncbi:MAG: nucleotidyl transferase AbiEii/AbiGii toxin family protein [Microthrixaceae bacterium]|jgi:predicted nucleotidyltransferase|nr:nucleotidyl transferase AbiEii/AbiGii toxin family protein [Microthrixaceae bacterium]